jgi:hypothetical protein
LDFKKDAHHTETQTYDLQGKTAVLTLKDVGENYDAIDLRIEGYSDSVYTLEKVYEARGRTTQRALENAQMIDYQVEVTDSVFAFPSTFQFKEDALFRGQELDLTLYIPYGQQFMMDRELQEILRTSVLYTNDLSVSDMQDNVFMFTANGLQCLTCEGRENLDEQFEDYDLPGDYSQDLDLENFDKLDIGGALKVEVFQGDTFKVTLTGREMDVKDVEVRVQGNTLEIEREGFLKNTEDLGILITMPALESMELHGVTQATISKFTTDNLHLALSGAARASMLVEAQELDVEMSSAANLQLYGTADFMQVNITGAAQLEAAGLEARRIDMECGGASRTRVNATEEINIDAGAAAQVEYTGNATINVENDQRRNVRKF